VKFISHIDLRLPKREMSTRPMAFGLVGVRLDLFTLLCGTLPHTDVYTRCTEFSVSTSKPEVVTSYFISKVDVWFFWRLLVFVHSLR